MYLRVFEISEVAALADAAAAVQGASGVRSLIVLLAEGQGWPVSAQDAWERRQTLPLLGGVFPRVLAQRRLLAHGGVVGGLPWAAPVHRITLAAQPQIPAVLAQAASLQVLTDGQGAPIQPLIDALYDEVGVGVRTVGGGCGTQSLRRQPCVLTAQGFEADVAAGAALPVALTLGVRHGWQPLDADLVLKATQAQGNAVHGLNWEPALAVDRRLVEPVAAGAIDADNFFEVDKAFLPGLLRADGEFIVRDSSRVEGEALVCVGRCGRTRR